MDKLRKAMTVRNKLGLHARPAALFVQAASKFDSEIVVEKDGQRVSGKSIMGILMLGVEKGSTIIIEADGQDAKTAITELERLVDIDESDIKA